MGGGERKRKPRKPIAMMDLGEPPPLSVKERAAAAIMSNRTAARQTIRQTPSPRRTPDGSSGSTAEIRKGSALPRIAAVNRRLAQADWEADVAADVTKVPVEKRLPEVSSATRDDVADRDADVPANVTKVPVEKRLPEVSSATRDVPASLSDGPGDAANSVGFDSWQRDTDDAADPSVGGDPLSPTAQRQREATEKNAADAAER